MTSDRLEGITVAYEEVSGAHDGITEFRAKLLALLPLASGAGIFLLLGQEPVGKGHLPAIGVFGAVVTFGLFLYEFRGVQKCLILTECGKILEEELLGEPAGMGAFTDDVKTHAIISNAWASSLVYSGVFAAWLYVAASELSSSAIWPLAIGTLGFLGLTRFASHITKVARSEVQAHAQKARKKQAMFKGPSAGVIERD